METPQKLVTDVNERLTESLDRLGDGIEKPSEFAEMTEKTRGWLEAAVGHTNGDARP